MVSQKGRNFTQCLLVVLAIALEMFPHPLMFENLVQRLVQFSAVLSQGLVLVKTQTWRHDETDHVLPLLNWN